MKNKYRPIGFEQWTPEAQRHWLKWTPPTLVQELRGLIGFFNDKFPSWMILSSTEGTVTDVLKRAAERIEELEDDE